MAKRVKAGWKSTEAVLKDFVAAYNFGRRLKTVKGLTPLRIHLQILDKRTRTFQAKSDPSNAGTEHLAV
jgi:RNA-directed DNA polymerase